MQKPPEGLSFGWWDMARSLYYLLDSERRKYFIYTTILIAVLSYDLIPTFIIAKIVDFFIAYKAGDSLHTFYVWMWILTISWAVVALVRLSVKKKLAHVRVNSSYFTRVKGFERLLDFSIKWHDKENTGNKVQKIQSGAEAFKNIQSILSQEVFLQITVSIAVLISFGFIGLEFLIIGLAYITIFLSVQLSFFNRIVRLNYENNILQEKASGTFFEGLNNILTIKTLGVKDDFKKNINSKEDLNRIHSLARTELMNNKWKVFQLINAAMIGVMLYLAGQGFISSTLTIGTIVILYNFFQRLNKSISDSTDTIDKLIQARAALARMMPIFWDSSSTQEGTLSFPKDWDLISIENASFRYTKRKTDSETEDGSDEVAGSIGFENISLKVEKNEKLGIVGRSGSGKSTLAKILLGLYELESGSYKIGSIDFAKIKHDEMTGHMALVLQDSEMFNLSLKENITLMRAGSNELFEKAISVSQLDELIAKLPDGVNTLIGEKGYRLSGGERQRLGIARAIYKDPEILVLDEATSSLDTKTETAIQKAIDLHLSEKTIITIAHRVSTLEHTNRIVVFEDGKIVEEGKYTELTNNPDSHFSKIYHQEQREQPML